jgi:hypothetical protein
MDLSDLDLENGFSCTWNINQNDDKVLAVFNTVDAFRQTFFEAFEAIEANKACDTTNVDCDAVLKIGNVAEARQAFIDAVEVMRMSRKTAISRASAPLKAPIIAVFSRFLCERDHIEWTGHFDEAHERWQEQGLSLWLIYFRTSYMTLGFLWAWIHCRVIDYILARYRGKPL